MKRILSFIFFICTINISTIQCMEEVPYIEIANLYIKVDAVNTITSILKNLQTYNPSIFLDLVYKVMLKAFTPLTWDLYAQLQRLGFLNITIKIKDPGNQDLKSIKILDDENRLNKKVLKLLEIFITIKKEIRRSPLVSRKNEPEDISGQHSNNNIVILDLQALKALGKARIKTTKDIFNEDLNKEKRLKGFPSILQ